MHTSVNRLAVAGGLAALSIAATSGTTHAATKTVLSGLTASNAPVTTTQQIPASPQECALAQEKQLIEPGAQCYDTITTQVTPAKAPANTSRPSVDGWSYWDTDVYTAGVADVWNDKCSEELATNGASVWLQTGETCGGSGFGYDISHDWKGHWNNGGGNGYGYMNYGDNFTVSFLYKGFAVHVDYWQRGNMDVNGNFWATGGKL